MLEKCCTAEKSWKTTIRLGLTCNPSRSWCSDERRRQCEHCLEGSRGSLWQQPSQLKRDPDPSTPETADDDFPKSDARPAALTKGSQLSRHAPPCSTKPLAAYSTAVAQEMRDRHPAPRNEDGARMKLLFVAPVSFATLPSISLVQEALFSRQFRQAGRRAFARSTSKERRFKGTETNSCGPSTAWSASSPTTIPRPIASQIARASLAALTKKDCKHRRVLLGKTFWRLSAKALLSTATKHMTPCLLPTQLDSGPPTDARPSLAPSAAGHSADEDRCFWIMGSRMHSTRSTGPASCLDWCQISYHARAAARPNTLLLVRN